MWFGSMSATDRKTALVRICKLARSLNLYRDSYASSDVTQSTDSDDGEEGSADSEDDAPSVSLFNGPIFAGPKKHVYIKRRMKDKYVTNTSFPLHSSSTMVTPTGDLKSTISSMKGSHEDSNFKRMKVCMLQYNYYITKTILMFTVRQ